VSDVPRIVKWFGQRGGSKQALHDMNAELTTIYGYDLYSYLPHGLVPLPGNASEISTMSTANGASVSGRVINDGGSVKNFGFPRGENRVENFDLSPAPLPPNLLPVSPPPPLLLRRNLPEADSDSDTDYTESEFEPVGFQKVKTKMLRSAQSMPHENRAEAEFEPGGLTPQKSKAKALRSGAAFVLHKENIEIPGLI